MPQESNTIEQTRRELCSQIFCDPDILTETLTHEIRGPFTIAPHSHPDRLQLDLLVGCVGRAFVGDSSVSLSHITAMCCYPGVQHGYELNRANLPARVYHLKLRCDSHSPIAKSQAFGTLHSGIRRADALVAALRVVVQLGYVRQMRSSVLLPRLTEVLCLWPNPGQPTDASTKQPVHFDDDLPTGLAAAVALIDSRLDNPPGIDELADVASVSARHFSRQFLARFGCTAHTYTNAKRLASARELLLQGSVNISSVSDRLGFSSVAIFSRWFRQNTGVTPRDYRSSATTL